MRKRWGWWLLWVVPFGVLVFALTLLFRRADNYLLFVIPYLVAVSGAAGFRYRGKHGFWPWDFKRRKMERYGWLVETSPTD
jgi:hypothetical protein